MMIHINSITAGNYPDLPLYVKKRIIDNSLYNPANWKRFMKWWHKNIVQYDANFDTYAALDEVDKTLSCSEAIDHITAKHPEWFRNNEKKEMVKQLVFVKQLIPLLITGEIKCTYRNRRFFGSYYIITNRFKRSEPYLVIEITNNELVKLKELDDKDARLAGIDSAKELKKLLKVWYGDHQIIFRNWLTVTRIL